MQPYCVGGYIVLLVTVLLLHPSHLGRGGEGADMIRGLGYQGHLGGSLGVGMGVRGRQLASLGY